MNFGFHFTNFWKTKISEVPKSDPNNTEYNYNNIIYTNPILSIKEDEIVDGIVDLILETVISKKDFVLVSGQEYPAALVKSKFLKLNYSHIEYVIGCMGKITSYHK